MLTKLDKLVEKFVPKADAGACIPPEPCACKHTVTRCVEGIRYRYYYKGTSNCLGNCTYSTYCYRTAYEFC